MKIRIKGNSVRIRIVKTELENFGRDGFLEEHTEFPNGRLTYRLQSKAGIGNLEADINGSIITVYMPEAMKKEWVDTETVGYRTDMPLGDGKSLFILIEKDFKCLDGEVLEDQSDNFDNPSQVC
ncbi:MAG: hypothetical protein JNL72_09920 [Flavipsychrobacter sp.]|nr:hypothetical protein [Flavipsychrobacter sp.]